MKWFAWLIFIVSFGSVWWGLSQWRKRLQEREQASEVRFAALLAQAKPGAAPASPPAASPRPAAPAPPPATSRPLEVQASPAAPSPPPAALTSLPAESPPPAAPAPASPEPVLPSEVGREERLLFDAADKAGEAGEPVFAIQLYARLLSRYPQTSLAEQARAAVEQQKKKALKA